MSFSRSLCIAIICAFVSTQTALSPALSADWGYENSPSAPSSKPPQNGSKKDSSADWGYESPGPTEPQVQSRPPEAVSSPEQNRSPRAPIVGSVTNTQSDEPEVIPPSLQPGKRFELNAVTTNLEANEKSFGMPHWLVGTWRCEYEIKYPHSGPMVNGVRHSRRELQTYGTFDSEKGWIYIVKLPRVHNVDEADFIEYRVEVSRDFPVINDTEVVTKYTFYAVQVDKFDGLIISSRMQNSVARITPMGKSEIQIEGNLKSLDTEGNREKSRSVLRLRRVVENTKSK